MRLFRPIHTIISLRDSFSIFLTDSTKCRYRVNYMSLMRVVGLLLLWKISI